MSLTSIRFFTTRCQHSLMGQHYLKHTFQQKRYSHFFSTFGPQFEKPRNLSTRTIAHPFLSNLFLFKTDKNLLQIRHQHILSTDFPEPENEETKTGTSDTRKEKWKPKDFIRILTIGQISTISFICFLVAKFGLNNVTDNFLKLAQGIKDLITNPENIEPVHEALKDLSKVEELLNKLEEIKNFLSKTEFEEIKKIIEVTKESEISELKKEHEDEIKEMRQITETDKSQLNNELKRAHLILDLYKNCKNKHLLDLHQLLTKDVIDLSSKHLIFSKQFSQNFIDSLNTCLSQNLNKDGTELNLYRTSIRNNNGLKHLFEGLTANTTIRSLNLDSTNFEDSDIGSLIAMLKKNTALEKINLSSGYISDKGITQLADFLEEEKKSDKLILKELNLSNTNVSEKKKEEIRKNLGIKIS